MPSPRPPGNPRSDRQLVAAIARGEDAALSEFLDLHGGWALAVAKRFVRDAQLAEDALQESLIHLVERAEGLLVADSIRPWFYSVIRFRAMEQQRQATRRSKLGTALRELGPTETDPAHSPPNPAAAEGADGVLRAAVGTLPEILREVLILRIVDGLTVAQTALALEIPEGTVKSRLHAALASLREKPGLGPEADGPETCTPKKT